MKKYIGVKIIEAEPMNLTDFNKKHNKIIPATQGDEGYKVVYPDGYTSWSPKSVFEEAYRLTDGMTFGLAVEALKKGLKFVPNGYFDVGCSIVGNDCMGLLPWIGMRTADSKFVPWLASQTDLIAEDWQVVG